MEFKDVLISDLLKHFSGFQFRYLNQTVLSTILSRKLHSTINSIYLLEGFAINIEPISVRIKAARDNAGLIKDLADNGLGSMHTISAISPVKPHPMGGLYLSDIGIAGSAQQIACLALVPGLVHSIRLSDEIQE